MVVSEKNRFLLWHFFSIHSHFDLLKLEMPHWSQMKHNLIYFLEVRNEIWKSEIMYTHLKENNWFGKCFVRNLFQDHDMESWYQTIIPSQVVWTRHRYITPRLSPVSYKWNWAGAVAQGLLYSLGYWSSDLLPVPKKVHGMADQGVVRWN